MASNASSEMTVIGRDTRIKGEMFFENGARILGRFEGKIAAEGEVQIGEGAECLAAVEAETVVVDGTINGDVVARGQLSLNENANVQGDITAGTLVVTAGASFVGHCKVGPEASAGSSTPATAAIAEPKPTLRQTSPLPASSPSPERKPVSSEPSKQESTADVA